MKILVAALIALSFAGGQSFAQDLTASSQAQIQPQTAIVAPVATAEVADPAAASAESSGGLSAGAVVAIVAVVGTAIAVGVSGGNHHNTDHGTTGTTK